MMSEEVSVRRFKHPNEFQKCAKELSKDGWRLHTFTTDHAEGIVYPYVRVWTKETR